LDGMVGVGRKIEVQISRPPLSSLPLPSGVLLAGMREDDTNLSFEPEWRDARIFDLEKRAAMGLMMAVEKNGGEETGGRADEK